MARDVNDRYQTAEALAADLQRFLDGDAPAAAVSHSADPDPPGSRRWSVVVDNVRVLAANGCGMIAAGLASGSVVVFDANSGRRMAAVDGRGLPVVALAFSADDMHLDVAWEDGALETVALRFAVS
jgi:hypothetical protein